MDDNDRQLLRRSLKLAEENNDLLRYLRGAERIRRMTWVIKWLVIVALSVGAYYVIAPYLDGVKQTYSGIESGIQQGLKFLQQGR